MLFVFRFQIFCHIAPRTNPSNAMNCAISSASKRHGGTRGTFQEPKKRSVAAGDRSRVRLHSFPILYTYNSGIYV